MRRAAKVDSNHRTIVAAFKALGCSVQSLAAVGKGVPDLLVGFANLNYLVEVKVAKGKETPAQVKWAALWRTTVHLVRSVEDVQRLVKAWRHQADIQTLRDYAKAIRESGRKTTELRERLGLVVPPANKWPLATMKPSLAVEQGFDADDYNGRPLKPGEWLPMPHKDSPTVKP